MSVIDNFPQILDKSQRWQVRQQYDTDLQYLPSRSVFTLCDNLALCTRYFEIVTDIQTRKRQESIGPRTADCPTFVTRSGPYYSSFPLHAKDETRRSLLQNASSVLRLHGHLKQLFINTPQSQVPTIVCWTHIYHSRILPTWRELYICTYIGHVSLSHSQGSTSFSTKLKSRFSFVPTVQLYGVFMGQISFFIFYRIACHIELGRVGGPPPTALLQSIYALIFHVRCTIIASSVKYTENAVLLHYKYQTVDCWSVFFLRIIYHT